MLVLARLFLSSVVAASSIVAASAIHGLLCSLHILSQIWLWSFSSKCNSCWNFEKFCLIINAVSTFYQRSGCGVSVLKIILVDILKNFVLCLHNIGLVPAMHRPLCSLQILSKIFLWSFRYESINC